MANYTGTNGEDTHTGTADADSIQGMAGNDVLAGGAGDDAIQGDGPGAEPAAFGGTFGLFPATSGGHPYSNWVGYYNGTTTFDGTGATSITVTDDDSAFEDLNGGGGSPVDGGAQQVLAQDVTIFKVSGFDGSGNAILTETTYPAGTPVFAVAQSDITNLTTGETGNAWLIQIGYNNTDQFYSYDIGVSDGDQLDWVSSNDPAVQDPVYADVSGLEFGDLVQEDGQVLTYDDSIDGGGGNDTIDGGAGDDTIIGGAEYEIYPEYAEISGDSQTLTGSNGNSDFDHSVTSDGPSVDSWTIPLDGGGSMTGYHVGNGADSNETHSHSFTQEVAGAILVIADIDPTESLVIWLDGVAIDLNDAIAAGLVTFDPGTTGFVIDGSGALTGTVPPVAEPAPAYLTILQPFTTLDVQNISSDGTGNGTIYTLLVDTNAPSVYAADDDIIDGGAGDDLLIGGVGSDVISGGLGHDTVDAGFDDDYLSGDDGDDSLFGNGGADAIYAGAGNDTADGGDDNDTISGGAGDDSLMGGGGDDTLSGDLGVDTLEGGEGDDLVTDFYGPTLADGGDGNDYMLTGDEDDTLSGGAGDDYLQSGDGADQLDGGLGADTIDGGAGDDTISGGADVFIRNPNPPEYAEVNGTSGTITGTGGNPDFTHAVTSTEVVGEASNTFNLDGGGTESVDGYAVGDATAYEVHTHSFSSDVGSVQLRITDLGTAEGLTFYIDGQAIDLNEAMSMGLVGFEAGTTSYYIDGAGNLTAASDAPGPFVPAVLTIYGPMETFGVEYSGTDGIGDGAFYTLAVDSNPAFEVVPDGDDSLSGGDGNDVLDGGTGNDTLLGEAGNDTLTGGDGDDSMTGGADRDTFNGAGGDVVDGGEDGDDLDTLIVNDVADVAYGGGNNEAGVVTFNDGSTLTFQNIETLIVDGVTTVQPDGIVHGTGGDDEIGAGFVDEQGDEIDGSDGDNDVVMAGDGDDSVRAGAGDDAVYGGAGNDSLGTGGAAGPGNDSLYGGNDQDLLIVDTGAGFVTVEGGEAGSDLDRLQVSDAGAEGVSVNFSGDEAGSFGYVGASGGGNFAEIEEIETGAGNDTVNASASSDGTVLLTADGEDFITGGTGDDYVSAGEGNDQVFAGDGADVVYAGGGADAVYGGVGDDALYGEDGNDYMQGDDGADWLDGGENDDFLRGDAGDDIVLGGAGNDSTYGGAGNDQVYAGDGNDEAYGGFGNDFVYGDAGDDTLTGSGGDDVVFGDDGDDSMQGSDGADTLYGGAGADTMLGEEDGDTFYGGAGDYVDGYETVTTGTDTDTLHVSDVLSVSFDPGNPENGVVTFNDGGTLQFFNIEQVYADGVLVAASDYVVDGTAGDDTIDTGYVGDPNGDLVDAGDALDGSDDDFIRAREGNDLVMAGEGNDAVDAGSGNDTVYGEAGDDRVAGRDGDDSVFGGQGDDFLAGEAGDDSLYGGIGNDTLNGGTNDDLIDGGDGDDNLSGDIGDDEILAGAGNDQLFGGMGNDVLSGEADDDAIYGGAGDDSALGGAGNDAITGGFGNDTLSGDEGDDSISAGAGDDSLDGGAGDDTLAGNGGSDTISGEDGNDLIFGGSDPATVPDGLTIWVNDPMTIYRIDIAEDGTAIRTELGPADHAYGDIGMNVDGQLYGVDFGNLYLIDTETGAQTLVGSIGFGAGENALSFGPDGMGYGAAGDTVYTFDPANPGDAALWWQNPEGGMPAGDFLFVGDRAYVSWYNPNTFQTQLLELSLDGDGNVMGVETLGVLPETSWGLAAGPNGEIYTVAEYNGTNSLLLVEVPDAPLDGGNGALTVTPIVGTENGDYYWGATSNHEAHLGDGQDAGDLIFGGAGDDTIHGAFGNDSIYGGDDNDLIHGEEDDDLLFGDAGNDTLNGDAGNDGLSGGTGDDLLAGGDGDDQVYGGDGADTLQGGEGNDLLHGDDGDDLIEAGAGDDVAVGGTGNDEIFGGDGSDSLYGGAGNDVIHGGDAPGGTENYITTGVSTIPGTDITVTTNGGTVPVTTHDADSPYQTDPLQVYELEGGELTQSFSEPVDYLRITLTDVSSDDYILVVIDGNYVNLNDLIASGQATFEAGDTDTFVQSDGSITSGTPRNEVPDTAAAVITIFGPFTEAGIWKLFNEAPTFIYTQFEVGVSAEDGPDAGDFIEGGEGDDLLFGGAGNDTLLGGDGADTMSGGDDRDTFFGGIGDVVDGNEGGDDYDTLDLRGSAPDGGSVSVTYDSGNAENGTVTFYDSLGNDIGSMSFSNIENVIVPCFTPGTLIATDLGEVRVEELRVGHRVLTRDNGYQAIRWIGKRELTAAELAAAPKLNPVRISQGALGLNLPERDLVVSPQHRMLVSSTRAELLFGEHEVLVAAQHLVEMPGIAQDCPEEITYIHLLLDGHEIVRANGAWTESYQPGDLTLAGMDDGPREELLTLFPELRLGLLFPAARLSLRKHEAKLLMIH